MRTVRLPVQVTVENREAWKKQILGSPGADPHVLVDMSATHYVDSPGLGMLYGAKNKLKEVSGSMRVVGLNEELQSLFAITKMTGLLSENEADIQSPFAFSYSPPHLS